MRDIKFIVLVICFAYAVVGCACTKDAGESEISKSVDSSPAKHEIDQDKPSKNAEPEKASDDPAFAKWRKAEVEMLDLSTAIMIFMLDNDGDCPESFEYLTEYFPNGAPKDPFTKADYIYEIMEDGSGWTFSLTCLGSDNEEGGQEPPEADIVVTIEGLSRIWDKTTRQFR